MDIYQIWTTYNKEWSGNEIVAFSILLLMTVIVAAGCVYRKKIRIIQAVAVVMMVIFLGIVFESTVFTRTSTVRQYELMPFWSWKAVLKYKDWTLLKEILLNCILLFPAGALLPIIANHKIKWYRALLFGLLVSAGIETSQLVFMRGLFEWDDMIHNGFGCMMGSMVFQLGVKVRGGK
jgi:glycopeptide antibiotics resistance protein